MDSTRIWYLLGRKLAGEATLEEIRELEQLLAAAPDIAAQAEIHSLYFDKHPATQEPTEEEVQAWKNQLQRILDRFPEDFAVAAPPTAAAPMPTLDAPRKGRLKKILLFTAAAAVIVPLILVFIGRPLTKSAITRNGPSTGPATEYPASEGKATAAEKTKATLPDGSIVWLNSYSRITYNKAFGRNNRDLTLTGEAFFDVVHKAELPMVVHAGPVTIRVIGTAFNVRSYTDDHKVEAALIRGAIELTLPPGQANSISSKRILLKPNQKITVKLPPVAGSQDDKSAAPVTTQAIKTAPLFRIDTLTVESRSGLIPEVSWIENKLVFNSEPLHELAEKMERWFHVTIKINDAALANEKFTGAFENETLEEALSALQLTYGFHYRIEHNKVFITKN